MADTAPNPDRPCPHTDFTAQVNVGRIGEADPGSGGLPRAYMCEVSVCCAVCAEPFRFTGVAAGMSFNHPMVSIDEKTLLAPIRPASADHDFGTGIPGYAVKAVYP